MRGLPGLHRLATAVCNLPLQVLDVGNNRMGTLNPDAPWTVNQPARPPPALELLRVDAPTAASSAAWLAQVRGALTVAPAHTKPFAVQHGSSAACEGGVRWMGQGVVALSDQTLLPACLPV